MPARSDRARLQGSWTAVSLEVEGTAMPPASLGGAAIEVEGDTFHTRAMDDARGTLQLSVAGRHKTLDLRFTSGPHKGESKPGIYRLDARGWTICLAMTGPRPTAFKTVPGDGRALETLVRDRPRAGTRAVHGGAVTRAPQVKRSAAPGATGAHGAPTEIDGEWTMVRMVESGKPLDAGMVALCRRITRDGETVVMAADRVMMRARFTLEEATRPRRIDYAGRARTPSQLGIYDLDGDRLTICMGRAGAARPSTFESRPGDGRVLTEWRRVRP